MNICLLVDVHQSVTRPLTRSPERYVFLFFYCAVWVSTFRMFGLINGVSAYRIQNTSTIIKPKCYVGANTNVPIAQRCMSACALPCILLTPRDSPGMAPDARLHIFKVNNRARTPLCAYSRYFNRCSQTRKCRTRPGSWMP